MAPELVSNYIAKTASLPSNSFNGFACDMWSLGVMLIQLLTGSLPFWPKNGFDYQSMQALLGKRVSTSLCMCIYVSVAYHMCKFTGILEQSGHLTVAFSKLAVQGARI